LLLNSLQLLKLKEVLQELFDPLSKYFGSAYFHLVQQNVFGKST